jgi:ArsR family transcriptional regulator
MSMLTDIDGPAAPPAALKVLSEPLRWRIVAALARAELCVCHLTEELDVPQPLVSHHLGLLRKAGIVESERWRYWTYYRLRPGALDELRGALESLATASAGRAVQRRPCC